MNARNCLWLLVVLETIAFDASQCVGYHESFESGAGRDGAYVCQLSITAPEFELRSGGPAALAVAVSLSSAIASVTIGSSTTAASAAAQSAVAAATSAPEYTFDEFKKTIWDADKVAPVAIEKTPGSGLRNERAARSGFLCAAFHAALCFYYFST